MASPIPASFRDDLLKAAEQFANNPPPAQVTKEMGPNATREKSETVTVSGRAVRLFMSARTHFSIIAQFKPEPNYTAKVKDEASGAEGVWEGGADAHQVMEKAVDELLKKLHA